MFAFSKKPMLLIALLGLIAAALSLPAIAHEAAHGNGALEIFDQEGMDNSPQWVRSWILFMMLSFAGSLLFAWKHVVARWVLGGFLLGAAAMLTIGKLFGVPPYSGYIAIFHLVFWSPALYQLLTKRPFMGPLSPYSVWAGIMTFVIIFSFVFDIRDAFIYLRHLLG